MRISLSGLRARLGLLVVFAMLPVIGLTFITYRFEREKILSHLFGDVRSIARVAASAQMSLIEGTRQLLMALEKVPEIRRGETSACRGFLKAVLNEYPRYENLGVAGPDGRLLCSAVPVKTSEGFANEDWFRHSVETSGFAMSASRDGGENGKPAICVGFPIIDDVGKTEAIVFAALNPGDPDRLAGLVELPNGSEYVMFSRTGVVLAYLPVSKDGAEKPLQGGKLARIIAAKGEHTEEIEDPDGVNRLYAFTPLCATVDTGLYVGVGIPASFVHAEVERVLVLHLTGLLLLLFLALFIVWFGSDALVLRRIDKLVGAARKLSEGDMKARTGIGRGEGELDRLARTFDEMAATLEEREMKLTQYEKELRSLASQLSLAEERERRRIAVDLHDRVGQALAISKMKLGQLKESAPTPALTASVQEVQTLIGEAIRETRSLIFKISSPILYELGLEAALEWLVEEFRIQHGVEAGFEDDGESKPVEDDVRALLFQAAGELLVNVAKHAQARHVGVSVRKEGDTVNITVEDDGVGFDVTEIGGRIVDHGGYGLFSIRERLRHVDGRFEVQSGPGKGTKITMTAPLRSA